MPVRTIQTTLTSGELDAYLKGRIDVKHYYNGADFLRNVFVLPQGGVVRRDGLRHIERHLRTLTAVNIAGATVTAPNGGTTSNATDDDTSTEFATTAGVGTTNPFVIIHIDFGSAQNVLFADVIGLRIDGGSTDSDGEVVWQYSDDNSAWTTFGEAIDKVDTTDRYKRRSESTGQVSHRYWRLARVGSTDLSTNNFVFDEVDMYEEHASTLSNARVVPFEFSTTQRYLMVFSDLNMRVFKNGVFQADVPSPYSSAELKTVDSETNDITTINSTQDLDTLLAYHEDHNPRKFFRDAADDEWNPSDWPVNQTPTHPFERETTTEGTPAAATGSGISFAAGAEFSTDDLGKFIRGNGGYGEIVSVASSTQVTMDIEGDDGFFDTNAIPAGEWTVEENVWSPTRGYQKSGVFFQGRLHYAGAKSRPSSAYASRAGTVLNFNIGDGSDADAIDVTADTPEVGVPEFTNIHVGRHLQLFSTAAEFYVPASEDEGLTPTNYVLRVASKHGSKKGVPVVEVAGATIFLQRGGKALREYLFSDTEQAYNAGNLSLLSSHLFDDPVDMAHRKATSTQEADYILLPNTDGTLIVYNTLRSQEINAFSLCETEGDFLNVAVDFDQMYFVVERNIDGQDERYIEVFDPDLRVDAGVKGGAASSVTGLDHLEGETVDIILDGAIQPQQTVASGTVTFARASTTSYQVGLPFPDVKWNERQRLVAAGKTGRQANILVYGDDNADKSAGDGDQVWIRDMPVEPNLPDGTAIGKKKRVLGATVRLKDTTGLWMNGGIISFQQFGSELLDQEIPEFSGDKTEDGLLGWDDFGQIDLTVRGPFKFELLALSKRVAV